MMKILILGIGNILFQDEGIGAHFVHFLDEKYKFSSKKHSVSIIDGGTLAQRLIPAIVDYDKVYIIDCISAKNSQAGDVYFFDYLKMPSMIDWQGSAHEVEMLQTLNMIKMNGDLPNTDILGVIPKRVADDTTFNLSDEMFKASLTMEKVLVDSLKRLGVDINIVNENITMEEILQISFKRQIINNI